MQAGIQAHRRQHTRTQIHISAALASGCSHLGECLLLPGVVHKEAVARLEKGRIQAIEGVLPLQLALGRDGIVPVSGNMASCMAIGKRKHSQIG